MVKTLCEDFLSYITVKKWFADFRLGNESTDDASWSGRPESGTTDHQIEAGHSTVMNGRCVTV